jgi:hypothetical protein
MQLFKRMIIGAAAAVALLGTVTLAQEVQPPFTWKGKGLASLIAEQGINEVNFDFELAVDGNGGLKGKTTGDEGSATIKHMFYGEQVDHHELPGYHFRRAIIVLAFNEQGGDPMLLVLDGRLLAGRFFTGELLMKRYEPYSETDKALGVGDPMATPMDEDYLPSSLKSALRKTLPFGMVKIEGAYQN